MSKIRIYGDTSGYVDLTAPAVADNSALSVGDIATSSDVSGLQTSVDAKLTPACGYFGYSAAVTIAAGTGVVIPFNTSYISNGITLSSNAFTFDSAGIYAVDWGCRPGTAADVWSVVDMYNATTGIVGKSYGFGTSGTEVGARSVHFMVQISNTAVSYNVRMSRASSMAIIEPDENQPSYPEMIPSIGLSIWRVG